MTEYPAQAPQTPAPEAVSAAKPLETQKDYKELLELVEKRAEELKDKYWKKGETAWSIYSGDESGIPFNILYSNTETMVPAVFSRKPIPRVIRRFDEARADMPAKATERMLSFIMDTNLDSYPSFMTTIEDSVMDAAISGQGCPRVRVVEGITVLDYVEWNKFVWGFCSRWELCPWVAFAHDLEAEEILEMFKDSLSPEQITMFKAKAKDYTQSDEKTPSGETRPSCIRVWEVWDKKRKVRHFLCSCAENCCLETKEDPLRLEGFYPIPRVPLTLVRTTTDTIPRILYKLYQEQAEELNEITRRLKKVIKAIRVRGIYASGVDDIKTVFAQDDDNVFVPSTAANQIVSTGKGLDAYIWMLPIEKLIIVAKELYAARNEVKGTIYEIMGIGDILRGVSKASETLGAQQLKDKWGSIRINKARERVATFIRDCLRLCADCAAKNTPEQIWTEATGMKLMSQQEFSMAQGLFQQKQVELQSGQMPPQAPGQPPPPPPQPPDPMTSWQGVLSLLQNDLKRAYTIDIETNSSVDPQATEEKAEIAEFMNAFGQTMAGLKDIMMSGPEGWEAGKLLLIKVCGKFQLGDDLEPALRNLQAPKQQDPAQLQKMMQEIQKRTQDMTAQQQAIKDDSATLKEAMNEAQNALKEIDRQKEQVASNAKDALKELDFAYKEAELNLREEALKTKLVGAQVDMKNAQTGMAAKTAAQEADMAGKDASMAGREAVGNIKQATQGLQAAHQQGVQKIESATHKQKLAQKPPQGKK